MGAQTVPQISTTVRQTLVRYRWAFALGLLIAVAALVAYRFTTVPAEPSPAADRAQASLLLPAQQGVLDELRARARSATVDTSHTARSRSAERDGLPRAHDRVDRSRAF